MSMTRILVCGGRLYTNEQHVNAVLSAVVAYYGDVVFINGGAAGADLTAHVWAVRRGIHSARMGAIWAVHGKPAGVLRNQAMLELAQPHVVVAFPGGPGTADMVKRARAAGIPTYEV